MGGVQPEVVISEDELIHDGDIKLGQLSPKLLHDHLTNALVELSTDVKSLLIYIRDEWLLELHHRIEIVEVLEHLCQDRRPVEEVDLQVGLGTLTDNSEKD